MGIIGDHKRFLVYRRHHFHQRGILVLRDDDKHDFALFISIAALSFYQGRSPLQSGMNLFDDLFIMI